MNQVITVTFENSQFENKPKRYFSISPSLQSASIDVSLPPRPKRPPNSFAMFLKEKREVFANMAPTATAPEIVSMLGKEWRNMDKSKYEEEFKRRREEYLDQVELYKNSLSDEQRELLKQEKSDAKKSKTRRELLSTKPPKHPRSPNNLYLSQRVVDPDMQELRRNQGVSEVFKRLNAEYRQLPDAEKQKFRSMADEDRERYRQEFVEWYRNVQQRDDLRVSTREIIKEMAARYNRTFFK